MKIEFKRLNEVKKSAIIELLNHPLVRRHMPLAKGDFDDKACESFIAEKEALWVKHHYGPWAFVIDGKFAGWGGLQFEHGDADLALVLHPDYWGMGKIIYDEIVKQAFGEMGLPSITVLFPPSRTRIKGLMKLGFEPDGELIIEGERFLRYRLVQKNFQDSDPLPHYLYKILSVENWKKSQSASFVVLGKDDDAFIHLAKEDQLNKITAKYWSHVEEYVILKMDVSQLPGRLVHEANPGGTRKYYHLYKGSIPLQAVVEVKTINSKK